MPLRPIPFTAMDKSIDKPGLSTFSQGQYDGYWQEYVSPDGPRFVWARRPGKTLFCDLGQPAGIDGGYYWHRQNLVHVACNGKVFRIGQTGTTEDVTGTAAMVPGNRPTFTDIAGSDLYIASGGRIGKFASDGNGAYIASVNAPTQVRFVGTVNKTLVALRDDDERFDWADAAEPDTWMGEYSNAEAAPDIVLSMIVANNYLYFHGQNTIEIWRDDGSTFVRETQGAIQLGTLARYSVCNINGILYGLDSNREVSRLVGFQVETISNPQLTRYLKTFSSVLDARGDYLAVEGRRFYVLSFPVEGKTLVYDIGLNQWYEWSYWETMSASRRAWIGSCVIDASGWNKTLVGDRTNSKIYEMTGTSDAGNLIRTVLQTDFVDRGDPSRNKFCSEVTFRFKRSDTATTPHVVSVSWRDDGDTRWQHGQIADIESQGATEMMVRFRRLGKYRKRQWRITMTDATQSALLSAQERFSYGR